MFHIKHVLFHHLRKYILYSNDNHSTFLLLTCSFLLLGRPTTLTETIGKAEMWLIRSYWDLEFPRPTLPNVDYVGGLHCKPAKPLPKVNTFFRSLFFYLISFLVKMILQLSLDFPPRDRDI